MKNWLANTITKIKTFLINGWHKLEGEGVFAGAEALLNEAKQYTPEALAAIKTIQGIAGSNPTLTELQTLGTKFNVEVTDADVATPEATKAFLQTCIEKEFASLVPNPVEDAIANYAIELAFDALDKVTSTQTAAAAS